jgi:hypothetical protein
MDTRTINVSVNIPKSYNVKLLQKQLTLYAQQLIASVKKNRRKHNYRHESLCGIFDSGATEEQLLDGYMQEKYNL